MTSDRSPARQRRAKISLIGWASIVLAVFVWQSVTYFGLVERAGEWQFHDVGSYYPAVTAILLIILFGVPLFYIFTNRANREVPAPDNRRLPAKRFLSVLIGGALVLGVAAVLTALVPMIRDMGDKHPAVRVAVGTPPAQEPGSGPATVAGRFRLDRTAIERSWLFGHEQSTRYIPVQSGNEKPGLVQYFVQASVAGVAPAQMEMSGTLRKNALPGHIVRLYENAGFTVIKPHYVLYTSKAAERAPYLLLAAQLGLGALVFGLAALFQRWRLRKLSSGHRTGTPHAIG